MFAKKPNVHGIICSKLNGYELCRTGRKITEQPCCDEREPLIRNPHAANLAVFIKMTGPDSVFSYSYIAADILHQEISAR